MSRPADLISWAYAPGLAGALTAQQVADRLFNSGLPLPERIFTGVGSFLFAPSGYGRLDLDQVAQTGHIFWTDEERFAFCDQHADQILLRAEYMKGNCELPYLDLTGRMLMLNAVSELIGCMYSMLGSNLMDPAIGTPVMRSYNMTQKERAFEQQLFESFRAEIEGSDDGWVDVLPVPGNANLIFLRGANGAFDWVVRDQRDSEFSSNPHYPFFKKDELPKAMDQSKLKGHLYFSTGTWTEKLEHDAESRHYAEGGTTANWPGYARLIQHELIASQGYRMPRPETGSASKQFIAHRCNDYCLMVAPLVTIEEFLAFQDRTDWSVSREAKALKAGYKMDGLNGINTDSGDRPVSVTWLDAVAYCRDFERRNELPVRLMTVEEWQQITPPSKESFSQVSTVRSFTVKKGEIPNDPVYEQMRWGVVGGDGKLGGNSAHCNYLDGTLRFVPNLKWVSSNEGAQFLSVPGFAEWLADYQNGSAQFACAATYKSIIGGPIERNWHPIHMTMKYKGAKSGFRLCYVSSLDS